MSDYILLFAIVLGVNLLPAFAPPTWSIIVLYSLNTDMPVAALVLVGAVAAASGRLALAYAFRYFGDRLPEKYRKNLTAAREALQAKQRNMILGLGLFALSPLPSAQLFAAAGFAKVPLLGFTAAFFAGRIVTYAIYGYSAQRIRETSMSDLFVSVFASPLGIALQIAMIGFIVFLVRFDWSKLKR